MVDLRQFAFPMLAFSVMHPLATAVSEDLLFINYHIHVTNDLPSDLPPAVPSLHLHCKSKDEDLGEKVMFKHEDYSWDAKINLFRTTLFFCYAWWEGKQQYFEAFKATRDEHRCRIYHNSCLWSVREDGIYFSKDSLTWYNEYPW
ncbi:hypothetical protein J1N35_018705 [Gossypium stocksii]|uniref:S-protein homolog n=1 Tax=Gossypium stocksii TaxID=47602 RepID=A0A9D4A6Y0_9ROSI|nr:hypothetical protein J1N35_018705 [Gossypium stocksii]